MNTTTTTATTTTEGTTTMNTALTTSELHDLIHDATGNEELADRMLEVVRTTVGRYNDVTEQLQHALHATQRDAARALEQIELGQTVNELGVFHQSTADANRYAALRQQVAAQILSHRYMLEGFGVPVTFADLLGLVHK
jgi:coenzyme F420-reducing hydrogenase alpha subunit